MKRESRHFRHLWYVLLEKNKKKTQTLEFQEKTKSQTIFDIILSKAKKILYTTCIIITNKKAIKEARVAKGVTVMRKSCY